MIRKLSLLSCAALLAIGLGACGDDDDDNGGGDAAGGGNVAEYCEASLAIETAPEPDIDFESLTEEQQKEESKKYVRETIRPLADRIDAVVPDEIREDADTLLGAVDRIEETGDFMIFETDPEIAAAERRVHAFDLENCDWESTSVTAVDYAFQGVPSTVPAGVHSFEFKNTGKELHEFVLMKKNAGVTQTFDQLLELPEEQARQMVTPKGGALQPPNGPGDYVVNDLDAGQYLAVCFVSVGTVSEDSEVDGPPHFTRGMQAEFTVA